jgi:hypothetical protein
MNQRKCVTRSLEGCRKGEKLALILPSASRSHYEFRKLPFMFFVLYLYSNIYFNVKIKLVLKVKLIFSLLSSIG